MTLLEHAPARGQDAPASDGGRRLAALDAFRGLTIAAMIVVNNQGDGAHAFPGTAHARWHGWTPADLVFPAFLFIVGASMAYSLQGVGGVGGGHGGRGGRGRRGGHGKVVRRSLVLVGLGLVLNFVPYFSVEHFRAMGVLQRIGVSYLLAALLVLHTPVGKQVRVAAVALVAYWAMLLLPVPGHGPFHLAPDANVPGIVDRDVFGPQHVYRGGGYDPEGLLSTIPAVVTVLAGYWAARWVRQRGVSSLVPRRLAAAGVTCVAVGLAWGLVLPVNKRLWTSSFTVLAAGFSLLAFALCYQAVEVRRWRRFGWWTAVLGMNAIVAYVGSELVGNVFDKLGGRRWLYDNVFSHAGLHVGSLLYALAFTALWWAVCWVLWRRRVFVKV